MSPAQKRFLADFAREGYQTPPCGYRGAGPDAARWWKTAEVLIDLGLVMHPVNKRFEYVVLTWPGLAWAVAVLQGEYGMPLAKGA